MTLARLKLAAYSLGENRSFQLSYRVVSSCTAFTSDTRLIKSLIINLTKMSKKLFVLVYHLLSVNEERIVRRIGDIHLKVISRIVTESCYGQC